MQQFQNAKELGTASAEEWTKGLDRQGQERTDDAIRWEQWDTKGGLRKVNSRPLPKPATTGIPNVESKDSNVKSDTFPEDNKKLRVVSLARPEGENASAVPHSARNISGESCERCGELALQN